MQCHVSIVVNDFPSVPFPILAFLGPYHILLQRVTTLLPLLHLFVFETCSAQSLCPLLLPALPIPHGFERFVPVSLGIRTWSHVYRGIVVGGEARLDAQRVSLECAPTARADSGFGWRWKRADNGFKGVRVGVAGL